MRLTFLTIPLKDYSAQVLQCIKTVWRTKYSCSIQILRTDKVYCQSTRSPIELITPSKSMHFLNSRISKLTKGEKKYSKCNAYLIYFKTISEFIKTGRSSFVIMITQLCLKVSNILKECAVLIEHLFMTC